MIKHLIAWLVFAFVLWNIHKSFRDGKMDPKLFFRTWRRVRWWMVPTMVAALTTTVTFLILLITYLPWTKWGWFTLLNEDGGNILTAAATTASASTPALTWLPYVFLLLLVFFLPHLAKLEEDAFRKGRLGWKSILKSAFVFGPLHLLAGIPIAAGIGLIVAGIYYSLVYRYACLKAFNASGLNVRGNTVVITLNGIPPEDQASHAIAKYREAGEIFEDSVMVSTAAHTLWNTAIVAVIVFLL